MCSICYISSVLEGDNMPPKVKFTREQIVQAAFAIANREGIEGITIRKVAHSLGSSIAPIYVNFETVEELKDVVAAMTFTLAGEMMKEGQLKNFMDIGLTSLRFAREYPMLFNDLVVKPNRYFDGNYGPTMEKLQQIMAEDPALQGLSQEEHLELLMKMRIFTTGLAVMAAGAYAGKIDEARQAQLLQDVGNELAQAIRLRHQ